MKRHSSQLTQTASELNTRCEKDKTLMQVALKLAQKSAKLGEIPVGAVIIKNGKIIARAHNRREKTGDPLDHAEIRALRRAAKKSGDWRLNDCEIYVTLEPCPMCLGALFQARIGKLIFGCADDKRVREKANPNLAFPSLADRANKDGSELWLQSNNHKMQVCGGVLQEESAHLLKSFFRSRRRKGL